jgi:hypothetical protein
MSILNHAYICSMLCVIVFQSMKEGMIFFPIRKLIDPVFRNKTGAWFRKPLYGCLTCMTSVWGVSYYLFTFGHHNIDLGQFIRFIAVVGGVNAIIDNYIGLTEIIQTDTHELSESEPAD